MALINGTAFRVNVVEVIFMMLSGSCPLHHLLNSDSATYCYVCYDGAYILYITNYKAIYFPA